MIAAAIPHNEEQRLEDLYATYILDTEAEKDFNHLVELAALICNCEMSVINFVDAARQWGKASIGLGDTTAPREISMCAHTILQNDVMMVEDTLQDERFFDNPNTTVVGIRFYAGATIRSEKGFNLGSICVCDSRPKKLSSTQVESLKQLSRQAAILLEVRKQNKMLEQLAITQRALKEKAEQAQKAQEQFLSTMSHEIRTPLNGIIGMVNILQSESPRPDQVPYLDTLQFASGNLLHIVNDILDFNKIASGKLSLEHVGFDLHRLLLDIKRSHEPKAAEKCIALTFNMQQDVPQMVIADPTRITQVLNNLIGNAVKFTLEGGVKINVCVLEKSADVATLQFEVVDTGIGFTKEQGARIFEQFLQASIATSRQFGGTGLGLSISKQLVELMGSTIEVKSAPGVGSSFSFALSLQLPAAPKDAAIKNSNQYQLLENLKVLIVEDNAVNVMITRKMLQKKGAVVASAGNGREGIERILESTYDLVLMDVHMPEMDGITALRQLRLAHRYTGPVILLTADVFIHNREEMEGATYNDYLSKPFTADELYSKICNCLQ